MIGLAKLIAAALLATMAFGDILPIAPEYEQIFCGEPGQVPCTVEKTIRTPTAEELFGLDNAGFRNWFAGLGPIFAMGDYHWSITDSNVNGYVIGHVMGGYGTIDTQFVFRGGEILCCYLDFPFRLYDINDNNFLVGSNIY